MIRLKSSFSNDIIEIPKDPRSDCATLTLDGSLSITLRSVSRTLSLCIQDIMAVLH